MHSIASRFLLCGLLTAAFSCGSPSAPPVPSSPPAAAEPVESPPAGVFSDAGRLYATLVFTSGPEMTKTVGFGGGHPLHQRGSPSRRRTEHAALLDILEGEGVRVLDIPEILDNAVENARRQGALAGWLRETFPATAERALERLDEIDARSLLNRRDDHFYLHDEEGGLSPLFPGVSAMYWSRDFAAMTPKGVVIGNGRYLVRSFENDYARLMFRYADQLADTPIVFDAAAEGVYLDGGDLIVLDERTLLLGVGNRSSREAAPKLARALDMDVLAVAMPEFEGPSSLRRRLLHLDTTFNIVDRKTALTLPFFYEKDFVDDHPLRGALAGLDRQLEAIEAARPDRKGFGESEDTAQLLEQLPQIGWLTRYAAATGEATELGVKLVDHLRAEGWRILFVGGLQGELPTEKYALERVFYELHWQGANVVQLGPGRVIGYEHNVHTNGALREAGIEVLTFPGDVLAHSGGGPHCLLMPLSRADLGEPAISRPPSG